MTPFRFLRLILAASLLFSLIRPSVVQSQSAPPDKGANLFGHAHSHNDYEHERPLLDALDNRFTSVEADIWLVQGEILVSHNEGAYKGSLKDLYLDPLQSRINDKGSVHGDGGGFLLWIDIKDGRPELNQALENLLRGYPMLTVFNEQGAKEGPVTAILTGDAASKERHVAQYSPCRACRDGGYAKDNPAADHRWRWIAARWGSLFDWDGEGEFPADQKARLVEMLEDIHGKGRKVRFWGSPDKVTYWTLAVETGIDLINTDRLEDLRVFLEGH
jgi:hypothetical protein